MNNWNIIWNSFCDEVEKSVNKKNLERAFEEDIARDFFTTLGWNRFSKELKEQYSVKFATATHRADFALFIQGKENPEVIIELKRPIKKKEEKDSNQLIDYMRKENCSYGILLFGTKLEIYYIDYSTPQHKATLVEAIKYQHNNDSARQLMEVIERNEYSQSKMLEYCHKRIKINKSIDYWCSPDGKTEILDMIVEASKLPQHLQQALRTTLVIDVKRTDGISAFSAHQPDSLEANPSSTTPPQTIDLKQQSNYWMLPANPKFFDHKRCFDDLGQIYWKQNNLFKAGDIVYIYLSGPARSIRYKCEVVACDLPYNNAMDVEVTYYKKPDDYEEAKKHNRFVLLKRIGETDSKKLSFDNLRKNGLNGAPMGGIFLSNERFDKLLTYIEKNF